MSSILDGKAEFGLCATKMCHNIGRQSCASLREAKRMGDKISVGKKISGGKTVFGLGRQNCVVALGGKTVLLYMGGKTVFGLGWQNFVVAWGRKIVLLLYIWAAKL